MLETVKFTVEGMGDLKASEIKKYESRSLAFLARCTGSVKKPVIVRSTGTEVWIDPEGEATKKTAKALDQFLSGSGDFRGRYFVNVVSSTGEEDVLPISALAKTEEFGGGAGVAGGSDLAQTVEAGQCIVCAKEQHGKDWKNFVRLGKNLNPDDVAAAVDKLDSSWKEILEKIASTLCTSNLPKGYWHWQDSFVADIQGIYKMLPDRLAGKFDRYNPADIWYTKGPYNTLSNADIDIRGINSLADLSDRLNAAFSSNDIKGISLKKTSDPEIQTFDAEKRSKDSFVLSNINIHPRVRGTLTVNIDFTFNEQDGVCQIRKDGFGYRATVKLNKKSEHFDGSVGKGIIVHILTKDKVFDQNLIKQLASQYLGNGEDIDFQIFEPSFYLEETTRNLADFILNNLKDLKPENIREAEEILEGVYPAQLSQEPETFQKGVFNPKEMAIAHSLDAIVTVLTQAGKVGQKEFLGRLLRYALSIHTSSCTFWKIGDKKSEAGS